MENDEIRTFVDRWIANWNARDLEGVLADFADDVVFTSPTAAALLGGDGVVRGKDALRAYWDTGLSRNPELHFTLIDTYAGINTIVINYRNQAGRAVNEVLIFDGPRVVAGHATHLQP